MPALFFRPIHSIDGLINQCNPVAGLVYCLARSGQPYSPIANLRNGAPFRADRLHPVISPLSHQASKGPFWNRFGLAFALWALPTTSVNALISSTA